MRKRFICPSGLLCGLMTEDLFTVLEGNSLILPCHYELQYASNIKYWCRGKMREFCTSLARTDDSLLDSQSEDKVTIFDDPEQRVFTVTMKNLTEESSDWYMCGVELGGFWQADVRAFTYIKVSAGEWRMDFKIDMLFATLVFMHLHDKENSICFLQEYLS